jgi:UDP-glucuronate 4-epimerase
MKYLVTGGAGFIGFHTARRLLEEGHEVVVIDNFNDYYDVKLKRHRASLLKKAKFYEIDISDYKAVCDVFKKEKFSKVIHLAAQAGVRYSLTNPFVYVESNVMGTLNIFEACRHNNVKDIVYASSSSVYGGNQKVPFSEKDRVDQPISLYAMTKRSDELMAYSYHHLYGLNLTGLRFFTVYGPYGRPDMAAWIFAKNIREGKPIDVFNKGLMKRDFTFVADIVDGIIKSSDKSLPCEVINLGNNKPVELDYFISLIEKNMGRKAKKNLLPMQQGDVPATWADISKAKKLLEWEPKTKIEAGISEFIKWFKESGF